jgi:hypothetical protein
MSQEDRLKEILEKSLEPVRSNLEELRRNLESLAGNLPPLPDLDVLSAEIGASSEPPPPTAASATPPINNELLYRAGAIEYASSQVEILKELTEAAQNYAQRGALFIVKADKAQGWSGFGFDSNVKEWSVDLGSDSLLETLTSSRQRMLLDGTVPGFIPEQGDAKRSLISPLLLKGKAAAFLYADSGSDGMLDHYSLDLLIHVASLCIDILPLHSKRDPLPPSREDENVVIPGGPVLSSPPPPAPKPAPKEEEALFTDSGTLAAETDAADAAGEAFTSAEPTDEGEVEVSFDEGEPEKEQAEEDEMAGGAATLEAAEEPIPEDEQKAHEDAMRFAKLLVQEIALYHPTEVEQGKEGKNLHSLLREDIERSREAYEQRFKSPSIRARDYFQKALVEHLAAGDASVLGD